ncbi:MAG: CPBP family intramembrane metalloprotease [Bacteroidales bacterium]|nr:CPBP family intramembrane metalloprotease [Bacteroidales bacterium]
MKKTLLSLFSKNSGNPERIRTVFLSSAGILLFAGFIHQPFPLLIPAIGGLALSAAVIGSSIRFMNFQESFGIGRLNRKMLLFTIPALLLGGTLGILTRNRFGLTLIPAELGGFVLVAPLIGAAEEIIFRGFIQGHLRPLGRAFSIIAGTGLHTCYKLLVILTLALPLQFDFFFLIFWTFLGGLLFGILRDLSGSTIPPVLAHAVFDILLYGGLASAPVWVWS